MTIGSLGRVFCLLTVFLACLYVAESTSRRSPAASNRLLNQLVKSPWRRNKPKYNHNFIGKRSLDAQQRFTGPKHENDYLSNFAHVMGIPQTFKFRDGFDERNVEDIENDPNFGLLDTDKREPYLAIRDVDIGPALVDKRQTFGHRFIGKRQDFLDEPSLNLDDAILEKRGPEFGHAFVGKRAPEFGHSFVGKRAPEFGHGFVGKRAPEFGHGFVGKRGLEFGHGFVGKRAPEFGHSFVGKRAPEFGHGFVGKRAPQFGHSFVGKRAPQFGHGFVGKRAPQFGHSFVGKRAPQFGHSFVGKRTDYDAKILSILDNAITDTTNEELSTNGFDELKSQASTNPEINQSYFNANNKDIDYGFEVANEKETDSDDSSKFENSSNEVVLVPGEESSS